MENLFPPKENLLDTACNKKVPVLSESHLKINCPMVEMIKAEQKCQAEKEQKERLEREKECQQ